MKKQQNNDNEKKYSININVQLFNFFLCHRERNNKKY